MGAGVPPHAQPAAGGEDGDSKAGGEGDPQHHERKYRPAAVPRAIAGRCDNRGMSAGDVELLRRAWEAFARGDLDAATEVLDSQVRWYGAGDLDGEGACHNRAEALAFIRRSLADGVTADALDFRDAGDRVVVLVQTRQPPEWCEQAEAHGEVVTVRDGKVTEIVVYPTVDEALAAARTA